MKYQIYLLIKKVQIKKQTFDTKKDTLILL